MQVSETILKFFSSLGLDFEQTKVVFFLLDYPFQTILKISQNTKIKRTTLYRVVDSLLKLGLLEEIHQEKRKLLKIVSSTKLEALIREQENRVNGLKTLFPLVSDLLNADNSSSNSNFKVKNFKKEEYLEIFTEFLDSVSDVSILLNFDLQDFFGESTVFVYFLNLLLNRKRKIFLLVGNSSLSNLELIKTKVANNSNQKNLDIRFISDELFNLNSCFLLSNTGLGFVFKDNIGYNSTLLRNQEFINVMLLLFGGLWRVGVRI